MSPQYAQSLKAERCWWRRIESEHTFVKATEAEAELIRAGRLLGHHHDGTYRRPAFQFDADTQEVLPVITALLEIARGHQVSAQEVTMWLCAPSAFFEEQDAPVQHLHDPAALLAAARDEFGAQW
jgi:hypothetical protein